MYLPGAIILLLLMSSFAWNCVLKKQASSGKDTNHICVGMDSCLCFTLVFASTTEKHGKCILNIFAISQQEFWGNGSYHGVLLTCVEITL